MATSRVRDMTSGPVGRTLLVFALPILCSNVLQNVYNLVDATLAGHLYGDGALAAIGASASLSALIITLAISMNGGFELVLARAFGSHDRPKFRRAIVTMLVLNLCISTLIAICGCLLSRPLLRLLNTPDEILPQSARYITIIIAGMPVTAMYNMESSLMRALGNSRTPLLFLCVATGLNLLLDLAFILIFDWGVAGLAAATVLAQLCSAALCLLHILRRYPELHVTRADAAPDSALYREMLATGFSMALMNSIFAIGTVCVQSAINALGTTIITAHTAARKLAEFMNMPQASLAYANATFISQNYGAGRLDRCRAGWKYQILYAWCSAALMLAVTFTLAPALVQLVSGSENPEVLRSGRLYLRIENAGLPVLALLQATRMYMQSIGQKLVPVVSSSIELAGKLLFTWIFIPHLGYLGVCISEPVLWVACTIFLLLSYVRVNRRLDRAAVQPEGAAR